MIHFTIKGATPQGGKSLCVTCKHAQIVKGQNCEGLVYCNANLFSYNKGVVSFKVAECSSFHPSNIAWLREMNEMAWIIEARHRGPKGFETPDSEMETIITPPGNPR
jgi:hypothetical protein